MRDIGWVPVALILFASTIWTFAIAMWRPQWLRQERGTRVTLVIIEGLVCALIVICIQLLAGFVIIAEAAVNGLMAAVCWAVPAYYSRSRYKAIVDRQHTAIPQQTRKHSRMR